MPHGPWCLLTAEQVAWIVWGKGHAFCDPLKADGEKKTPERRGFPQKHTTHSSPCYTSCFLRFKCRAKQLVECWEQQDSHESSSTHPHLEVCTRYQSSHSKRPRRFYISVLFEQDKPGGFLLIPGKKRFLNQKNAGGEPKFVTSPIGEGVFFARIFCHKIFQADRSG